MPIPHEMMMDSMMPCVQPIMVSTPMTVSMIRKTVSVVKTPMSRLRVKKMSTKHAMPSAMYVAVFDESAMAV